MFEAFLKENVIVPEVEKAVISKRFLGKDGKPVPWELRAISEEKHTEIKRECTKRKRIKGVWKRILTTSVTCGVWLLPV